ncbi:MAG: outer membrane lipoprotein chaperone LolA [Gammaproteobacteria bacterium]|nr:outer membrane lipoprotein chaperone LolA [Gammaproteobacteria bacterium]
MRNVIVQAILSTRPRCNWGQVLCIMLVCWVITPANAGSATERLNSFFEQVTSMRADFSQTIVSKTHSDAEQSKGTLIMQRPGRFRWDYVEPYEQQIIADGKKLWIYDIEMEQVIVKPLDLVLGNTPAALLSGNVAVTDKFIVKKVPTKIDNNALFWLELLPKDKEAGFQQLLLAFSGNELKIMELTDAFERVTRISFSNIQRNPDIDDFIFQFKVPPGVDVIDEVGGQ